MKILPAINSKVKIIVLVLIVLLILNIITSVIRNYSEKSIQKKFSENTEEYLNIVNEALKNKEDTINAKVEKYKMAMESLKYTDPKELYAKINEINSRIIIPEKIDEENIYRIMEEHTFNAGKCVAIDIDKFGNASYNDVFPLIPKNIRANDPEEVETIMIVKRETFEVGHYKGTLASANTSTASMKIYDKETKQFVIELTISDTPSSTIYFSDKNNARSQYGKISDSDIAFLIRLFYSLNNKSNI